MTSLRVEIMRRIRAYGRGKRVFTPKDFLRLGTRAAVDQVLSRLVKGDVLRRVGRGLYDFPRTSAILKRHAPPNVDAAVEAIARRDNVQVQPDGIVAANQLGLTNAVPAKNSYLTDGTTRTLKVGGRTIYFRHVGSSLMAWTDRLAAPIVQAINWLGKSLATSPKILDTLRRRVSDAMLQDLLDGIDLLPAWIAAIVEQIDWTV